MNEAKYVCPRCGAEMNHHADKLLLDGQQTEAQSDFPDGTLLRFYSCPQCGAASSQAA
jgi:predicted RNA-binding Zn-ribbon protein involved in translation (DUF1610 family)